MSHLIKITDPKEAKQDEIEKREEEQTRERLLKNPTKLDKLDASKSTALLQKDKVTDKIRKEGQQKIRFYKFTHPDNHRTIYGSCLTGQDMPEQVRENDGIWISPDEYYLNTNEDYYEMTQKGPVKLVKSLLDIEIVRGNPEFEKQIRAKG